MPAFSTTFSTHAEGVTSYMDGIPAGSVEVLGAGNWYDLTFGGVEQENIYLMFVPCFLIQLVTDGERGAARSRVSVARCSTYKDVFTLENRLT